MALEKRNAVKTWTKTKVQGLMRHRTGKYYARLFVGDKEKWVSLKTSLFEVARAKMRTDETVGEIREVQERREEIKDGKMKVQAAIDLFTKTLGQRVALGKIKPSTEEFWRVVLGSIKAAWLESAGPDEKPWTPLEDSLVGQITSGMCKQWAAKFAKENSPTYTNNAIDTLRKIFDHAIEAGALHRNPAAKLERARVRVPKLELPTRENFYAIVEQVRQSGHRTAKDAAETIQFLAFSGCRIGEARRVTWSECDFQKGEVKIKGDPATGTKNWAVRSIPMIPALFDLLRGMRTERAQEGGAMPVLRVTDVRGSLSKACEAVGTAHLTHHDLRHLFATVGIESDVDVPTVSRWLGHKDGGVLAMKVYGHLRDEHSRKSAQKVDFARSERQDGDTDAMRLKAAKLQLPSSQSS